MAPNYNALKNMIIRGKLLSGFDAEESNRWLMEVGLFADVESWKNRMLDIDIRDVPPVLVFAAQADKFIPIMQIVEAGVTFYLSELLVDPLAQGNSHIGTEHADGCVFVPMSNIASLNTFGHIGRVPGLRRAKATL